MTPKTRSRLLKLVQREDGQTLVEYALIIMLVALALITALGALAGGITELVDSAVAMFAGFGS